MSTKVYGSEALQATDRYFTNVRQALAFHGLNPVVTYRCFMRVDSRVIYKFIEEYLDRSLQGKRYTFKRLHSEGDVVPAKVPLFELHGNMQDLVELETSILWYTGWPSLSCYNASRIVTSTAPNVKLVDMAARHCPGPEAVLMASYAAHVAGFHSCSTDFGGSTFGGQGVGTMPHAWIGAFGSTLEAAKAFAQAFPDRKISVLVDYYGRELDDSIAVFNEMDDNLDSVRIDTHGGRFCQGVTNTDADGDFAALQRLSKEFNVSYPGQYADYAIGRGVTVEAVYCLRKALDSVGGQKVGITVSSGFTPEKVEAFRSLGAPVNSIGTGSFLPVDMRDTYATMDIIEYDGKKKIKTGREWLLE